MKPEVIVKTDNIIGTLVVINTNENTTSEEIKLLVENAIEKSIDSANSSRVAAVLLNILNSANPSTP